MPPLVTKTTKISEELSFAGEKLIHSKNSAWPTFSELLRDALTVFLASKPEGGFIGALQYAQRMEVYERGLEELGGVIDKAEAAIKRRNHKGLPDTGSKRVVEGLVAAVQQIPDKADREYWMDELRTRWPAWVSTKISVPL